MPVLKRILIQGKEEKQELLHCTFLAGYGIEGDEKGGKGEHQVTFSSENPGRDGGLCGGRYEANVTIEGLDFADVKVGSLLCIGSAQLRVVSLGKDCFPQCALVKEGRSPCYLKRHCGFLSVEQGGASAVETSVWLEP